jgi:hypothetical protein
MICARGKGKRNLRLVARDAARRFTLRRDRRKSGNGWLPLVLRWRQRPAAHREVSSKGGPSRVSRTFFPQTHFHFVTHHSGSDRVRTTPGTSRAATIYRQMFERRWTNQTRLYDASQNQVFYRQSSPTVFAPFSIQRERVVSDRNRTSVVTISRVSDPSREYRPSPVNYFISRRLPKWFSERPMSLTSSRTTEREATGVRQRRRKSAVPQIWPTVRVNTRRDERIHVFKSHLHTREYQPVILAPRAPSQDTLAFVGSTQRKAARVQFDRAEELVWRRTQRQPPKDEIVGRSITPATSQPNPVPGVVEETPAPSAPAAVRQSAPPPITKLDPGLIDRLTNDVIRRIEQHARIERQRRGL